MCVCKWGRSGLLVSQRDWPALQQVDLRSRSQSQWLVSHLPPFPFTPRNNFDTLPVCLTPLAVGDLWVAGSLTHSIPPFSLFSRLRVFCMKMCSPFSAGLESYRTKLTFFMYCISFLAWTRGHRNLTAALLFFSLSKLPLSYFYIYYWSTLVQFSFFFLCLSICSPLSFFYSTDPSSSLITFLSTLAPTSSLLDSTPVNLPMIVLCVEEKFFFSFFWSTRMKPCWTYWPKVHQLSHHSQLDSFLQLAFPTRLLLRPFLQTITYCSWFAVWSCIAL